MRLQFCAINTDSSDEKRQRAAAAAAAQTVYAACKERCPADCSTERWVWEPSTLVAVCREAELPLSTLAELAFHYIPCILSSISRHAVSSLSVIRELLYIFCVIPRLFITFHTPLAHWSHWDSVHEDNRSPGGWGGLVGVVANPGIQRTEHSSCLCSLSDSHCINNWSLQTKNRMSLLDCFEAAT